MVALSAAATDPWVAKLRSILAEHKGARFGEAAVVSRQLHMADQSTPETVIVLPGVDAGQQFYGRPGAGEVVHIDIFHAVADVDHRQVAAALLQALGDLPGPVDAASQAERPTRLLDYFDLCTGTGAGRVTGDLTYGSKPSLRAAHRNHVHLAGLLPDSQLHLLVTLVGTVEAELKAQGVEIRRVERLRHGATGQSADLDLSAYTDATDSLLRGEELPGKSGGGPGQPAESAGGAPGPAGNGVAGPGGGAREGGGAAPLSGEEPAANWSALADEQRLQAVLDLSRRMGSPDEVKRVLDELSREQGWGALYQTANSQAPFITRQLEEEGLVRRDLRGLRLTEEGHELARYLQAHLRTVKLRFRKLIRRLPVGVARQRAGGSPSPQPPSPDVRYGPIRGIAPARPGAWLGDLAVPETVLSALKRTRLERIQADTMETAGLRLQRADVHVHLRSAQQPLNICLLIDASASMAGRRILAAKHLVRHLLVSTRDRIAVIAFQERDVQVYVPFTRDYGEVEEGLARIQPMGLTPLAQGLIESLALIQRNRVRRPLLLLITDGIPTVPQWSTDASADALTAARQVGARRIPFGCIGLQPSRRYLEELSRAGGGTLHVVEELAEDTLITIAHRERLKLTGKAARA